MTFIWTTDRISKLRRLYIEEGLSAADTAKGIGPGCTRNAVIGKAHRLGLMKSHRREPSKPSVPTARSTPVAARPSPPRPGSQRKVAVIIRPVANASPDEAERKAAVAAIAGAQMIDRFTEAANDTAVPLMERRRFQCSWPVGVPSTPAQQLCCGLPVPPEANKSVETYCAGHAAKAVARVLKGGKPDAKAYERSMRRFAA